MSTEEVGVSVDPSKKLLKTGDLSSEGKVVPGGRVSLWKLCAATVCFAGVQFGWALQIALLTPFILELGLSSTWVTFVWLCGPISGFVVQPTVGQWSDFLENKLGRRRPFIIVGAIFIAFALLLIPSSPDLGALLGDEPHDNPAAIGIAIFGFWVLDFANNTLQGPCRALLADIAGDEQHEVGNSIFSFWLAVGNVLGYLAGWMNWSEYFPWFYTENCDTACVNLRVAFLLSIIFLTITVTLTVVYSKETPFRQEEGTEKPKVFKKLWEVVRNLTPQLKRLYVCTGSSWFGWFAVIIYATTWVGQCVNNGDPHADEDSPEFKRYEEGVRYGSFGYALFAIISGGVSPFIGKYANKFGPKIVWTSGQIVFSVLLCFSFLVTTLTEAVIFIGLLGYPWAVTLTVPFALTAEAAPEEENGVYMGVLNIFVVIPQFMMAAMGPLFVEFWGNDAPQAAFIVGGITSIATLILIPFLIIKKKEEDGIENGENISLKSSSTEIEEIDGTKE